MDFSHFFFLFLNTLKDVDGLKCLVCEIISTKNESWDLYILLKQRLLLLVMGKGFISFLHLKVLEGACGQKK